MKNIHVYTYSSEYNKVNVFLHIKYGGFIKKTYIKPDMNTITKL